MGVRADRCWTCGCDGEDAKQTGGGSAVRLNISALQNDKDVLEGLFATSDRSEGGGIIMFSSGIRDKRVGVHHGIHGTEYEGERKSLYVFSLLVILYCLARWGVLVFSAGKIVKIYASNSVRVALLRYI
jgi:hypothetical protein